ncbi:MAG TPA: 2-dehydropantoate 2-reductase [Acetobacteraceae bacterium]|nr:2-dehydropantoate 2-reductase [Acetobacteraceae bacterium]
MRICIYGAGSVGGYLAASLAQGGADVSVVARGPHLAAIQANGLTVETPEGSITARLAATADPADLGLQDAVIVTVKSPALPAVAASITPLLGPDTPVAFVMNGIPWWYFHPYEDRRIPRLDPGDALWNTIGPHRAIGGVFWPACSVPAPGIVRLLSGAGRGTTFGEPDGSISPRIDAIAAAFRAASLPVTIAPNIRELIWQKLAFNLSAGPMCILTQSPVRATHEESALIDCSRRLVAEAEAISAAMGYALNIDIDRVVATNTQLAHRPSILQDLEAGRPMEIDALYGVPLELARLHGIATPTLDLLVAMIKEKARAAGLYNR